MPKANKDQCPEYQEAVANGGFLTHIKRKGEYSSLCGHSPDSPKGYQFHRGRWKWIYESVDIAGERLRWCQKCRTKYLKETNEHTE